MISLGSWDVLLVCPPSLPHVNVMGEETLEIPHYRSLLVLGRMAETVQGQQIW